MEAKVVDRPDCTWARELYEAEDGTEPEECASCGSCEHFDIAPNWHNKPFQGPADGICCLGTTHRWVTEDEGACEFWEEA